MSSWLETLNAELAEERTRRLMEPSSDLGAEDHKLGTVDEDLKVLYSLGVRWMKAATEAAIESEFDSNKEMKEAHKEKALQLKARSDALLEIFWISVKDRFDVWDKPCIGVRSGWILVWTEQSSPERFLKKLLGGLE